MQFYKVLVFTILISAAMPILAIGQEKETFDITVAGVGIGEMTAFKNVEGDVTFYTVISRVNFWFFGWVSVDYKLDSEYKANQLLQVNGVTNTTRGEFTTSIAWQNDHYTVDTKNYKFENSKPINTSLYHNSALFFFEEPEGISETLADNFGLVATIRKVKDHYEVNVDGNKNRFYYVDGKLDRAVMYNPIKNYVIKRR